MRHKILFTLLMMLCSSSVFAYDYCLEIQGADLYLDFISTSECKIANSTFYSDQFEIPGEFDYNGQKMTITSIGSFSIFGSQIKKIVLPNTITTIENNAIRQCESLSEIILQEGITTIEDCAFVDLGLESIEIPGTVTTIGKFFEGCSNLTEVKLSEGTTTIDKDAFAMSAIKSIDIPNSVTTIGPFAFFYCWDLESVTFGSGLTMIDFYAFKECKSLKRVRISAEVPPTCNDAFDFYSDSFLEVPKAYLDAYRWAPGWSNYSNLIAYDEVKCATPTITITDGKLLLGCETENVTLHYKMNGEGEMEPGEFTYPESFEISVYATAEGCIPSEPVSEKVFLPANAMGPDGGVTEIYIYDDSHTDITLNSGDVVTLSIKDGVIHLENLPLNDLISVHSLSGETLMAQLALEDTIVIKLPRNDTYIIKVGDKSFKVKI